MSTDHFSWTPLPPPVQTAMRFMSTRLKTTQRARTIHTRTNTDVRVLFPPEAQGLARGFRQPGWTSEMTLYDYLPLAQTAVARPWRERKQLVATLAARHSVLEYDAQDFTLLHLFMKVRTSAVFFVRALVCECVDSATATF